MKKILILLSLCCLPLTAYAQSFTASLSGDAGTGFATLVINGNTIDYSIVTSGLDPAPATASLATPATSIDLNAAFVSGSAFGSVDSPFAPAIIGEPEQWQVEVSNGTTTLTGTLEGGSVSQATSLVFAVAANVVGQAGTNYLTDARIINTGASATTVTLAYYQSSATGLSAPTATADIILDSGEQAILNDIVAETFGLAGTKGGVVATADGEVLASMRIYNDQSAAGLGTFGQYLNGIDSTTAPASGILPFLSNEDSASGAGYRSNIGWFNSSDDTVTVTFTAFDSTGSQLAQTTFDVLPMAQEQFAVSAAKLFPVLNPYGDFYVSYSAAGSNGLFVYASVVDNVNGDAIFIMAE